MRVLLLFIAWSLVEIALYVTLGGWLGLGLTLAWVVGTGVVGIGLIRWQGGRIGMDLQRGIQAARDPMSPMAHSALILVAALLLILPGFLTDALGLVLLIPAVRRGVIAAIAGRARRAARARAAFRPDPQRRGDVIDAEVVEAVPVGKGSIQPSGKPSGWTQS